MRRSPNSTSEGKICLLALPCVLILSFILPLFFKIHLWNTANVIQQRLEHLRCSRLARTSVWGKSCCRGKQRSLWCPKPRLLDKCNQRGQPHITCCPKLSSRVGQRNPFSTTGQGSSHVFQTPYIEFRKSLVQPKAYCVWSPIGACPLHHHNKLLILAGGRYGLSEHGGDIYMGLKNMEAGRWETRTCDIGSKHRPKPSRVWSTQPG